MDFKTNVNGLHAKICELGYESVGDLERAFQGETFPYKGGIFPYQELFKVFALDTRFPQIVSDKKFLECPNKAIFSGNKDIDNYINRFQKGPMKTFAEHKHGYIEGLGYYFTEDMNVALNYCFSSKHKREIMTAKCAPGSNFVNNDDLFEWIRAYFPNGIAPNARITVCDDFTKKRKIVRSLFVAADRKKLTSVLAFPPGITPPDDFLSLRFAPKTIAALIFGFDGIALDSNASVIANRSAVIQPENPIVRVN